MTFNSFTFLACFALFYTVYVRLDFRRQNGLLLVASYLFYAVWDWRFLGLILLSTAVDYTMARTIAASQDEKKRLRCLWVSVVVNLGVLGFFKYFNFFLESAYQLLGLLGIPGLHWRLDLALPVGISFYTFKTLSYTLDVYGRQMEPTHNFAHYAAFVAFFPQLLSGPIDRAATLLPQIQKPRRISTWHLQAGIWLFLWGLCKKTVMADNLALLVGPVFSNGPVSGSEAWFALYAFAIQLYCDFSGYTDMARGIAKLMGFETSINFRQPYFTTNPMDFWKRWHISLTSWVQDYLYIPIAAYYLRKGSGILNQYMPHVLTMGLIGLWHGASMNFVLFGVYWGVALALYASYRNGMKKRARRKRSATKAAASSPIETIRFILRLLAFFHVVCFSLVLFRAGSIAQALRYYRFLLGRGIAGPGGFADWLAMMHPMAWQGKMILFTAALVAVPLFLFEWAQARSGDELVVHRWPVPVQFAVYLAVWLALFMSGVRENYGFIYVQF